MKNGRLFCLILVSIFLFACAGSNPGSSIQMTQTASPALSSPIAVRPSETAKSIPAVSAQPTLTAQPASDGINLSDGRFIPKTGKGNPPGGDNSNFGPWATRLMLAVSPDGLAFSHSNISLGDQIGVPNTIVDHDGRVRIYYVDYGNGNVIATAIQKDEKEWAYFKINLAGSFPGPSSPVDPTVVTLGDGRYRLYYMYAGNGQPSIYSAISKDGINFTSEEGTRFAAKDNMGVFDPALLLTPGGWLMWIGPNGHFSAVSQDGLSFTSTGEFIVGGKPFMTWSALAVPSGGFRIYGNQFGPGAQPGISSAFSTDGKSWKLDAGERLSSKGLDPKMGKNVLPDNGTAVLPDGTYLMAYLAEIP